MKDEFSAEAFAARLDDMCDLALKRRKPVYSAFLNEREQYEAVLHLGKRNGISIVLWGGHEACVRRMLAVSEADGFSEPDNDDMPIYPLTLTFRRADKPGHRDMLGAFMALGIKRETVGDIFIGDGAAAVFCTKTARDMISDSLAAVGRIGVSVSDGISDAAAECIKPARFEELTVTVASGRADCIISGITGLSRERSAAFIRGGSFMLNYSECCNISKDISEGDVLTLRGYGKFVVGEAAGTTKKGRSRFNIKKYI